MLQSQRREVRSAVRWEQLKIGAKELGLYHDSLTDSGIALGATLVSQLAFTAVREIGPWESYVGEDHGGGEGPAAGGRGAVFSVHAIFVLTSICAACFGVQCVVVCASAVVFGPGLALRGQRGEADMAAAIGGMREERDAAFRWFLRALYCLELSILPLSWLKLKSAAAACASCVVVGLLLLATRSFAVRRIEKFFHTDQDPEPEATSTAARSHPATHHASRGTAPSAHAASATLRHRSTSQPAAQQHGPPESSNQMPS